MLLVFMLMFTCVKIECRHSGKFDPRFHEISKTDFLLGTIAHVCMERE